MTQPPETHAEPSVAAATRRDRLLPPARYRHPGDVIRLIIAGLVLVGAMAVTAATHGTYAGASATAVTAVAPSTLAGQVLTGLVQGLFLAAVAVAVVVTLRHRRYRLLAGLAGSAVVASAAVIGIVYLAGGQRPRALTAGVGPWSWLTGASLAGPALGAAAVACTVAAAPWLTRPWRRAAWITLWLAAVARLITGTASPMEVVVAFAAGVTVGAGALVLLGVPDRRIGPQEIAAALGSAGLPVTRVNPAEVAAKGSRPFTAATQDGQRLFIKVLGSDQRDADLLYRAYRFLRLRDVGDTRPAASLIQAAEHQALVAVMAGRAGVTVPAVRQVIKTADGSALLAMDRVDGRSLDLIPVQRVDDTMIRELWTQVDRLHRAKIAHRSLRAANIVVDGTARPWIVDFSFAELGATQRQIGLDIAELLASLAVIAGADRAVCAAADVIGKGRHRRGGSIAPAARSVRQHPPRDSPPRGPADRDEEGRRRQRPQGHRTGPHPAGPPADPACGRRGRGSVLPPAAQAGPGGKQLAGHAVARLGLAAAGHRPVGRDLPGQRGRAHGRDRAADQALADRAGPGRVIVYQPRVPGQRRRHGAERQVPAEVGRPGQRGRRRGRGEQPGRGRRPPDLDRGLLRLGGQRLGQAFKLPSSSKLLAILAVIVAVTGLVLATRPGRRFAKGTLLPGLRSAAVSLGQVARNPGKMAMLFGGSALVTLAYIGAFAASVEAFGGGPGVVVDGAVYLGASALAAVAPTPGGLGTVEAASVAGLTGVGMAAGPAVSAVLLYRLATYWLPVAPGWLCWRVQQRREYV
jgi:glycosyltransferase 2 family protein